VFGVATTYGIVGTLTFVLNVAICIVFFRERLWKKNKFFFFVISLAFADALIGLTNMMFLALLDIALFSTLLSNFTTINCYQVLCQYVVGIILQELITTVIAIERLMAVLFPIAYRNRGDLTTYIVIGICVGVSLLIAFCGFGALIPYGPMTVGCTLTNVVVPTYANFIQKLRIVLLVLGVLLYVLLLFVSLRNARQVAPNRSGGAANANDERRVKKQAQITRTVVVLVLVYVATTGTALCIGLVMNGAGFSPTVIYYLGQFNTLFNCFNCLLNVFIFPLKLEEIHDPLKALANKLVCGKIPALATTSRVQPMGSSMRSKRTPRT